MPLGDLSLISSTSTFFTCLSARLFLKEAIDKVNLISIGFVVGGLILLVQPPFIFTGESGVYAKDSLALYSALASTFMAIFVYSNVFVLLRSLKGKILAAELTIVLRYRTSSTLVKLESVYIVCLLITSTK